jgi:hypothetical protein
MSEAKPPRRRNAREPKSTATFEDGDEPDRCRAKSKNKSQDGNPVRCGRKKEPGYNVCRYHGAGGGRPIIHGRYSKRLGRFREAYEQALESGEGLLDLRETLALLELHVQRAAERASEADTPQMRARALELCKQAQAAEPDARDQPLEQLATLLEAGVAEDEALAALADAADRMAVRQEKAWGVRLHAAQVINARDLVVIMGRIVDIILEEAPDNARRLVERIDAEVMGGGSGASRIAAGG